MSSLTGGSAVARSGAALVAYFAAPTGSNSTLLVVGFPLGFFASGCFSGFGPYLSETAGRDL